MAEAWFNHLAEQRGIDLSACSAGTDPSTTVQPLVSTAMAEHGIDISLQIPKVLSDDMVSTAGRVVTMGCNIDSDKCPAIRFQDLVDWGLPDPVSMDLDEVRSLRDVIHDKVDRLLTELINTGSEPS